MWTGMYGKRTYPYQYLTISRLGNSRICKSLPSSPWNFCLLLDPSM